MLRGGGSAVYEVYQATLISSLSLCLELVNTTLTLWYFFFRKQAPVHVHGEVHHVGVTEEVQLSMKELLLIVDLQSTEQ